MYVLDKGNKEELNNNPMIPSFFKMPEKDVMDQVVQWELRASSFSDEGEDFTELALIDADGKVIYKSRETGY